MDASRIGKNNPIFSNNTRFGKLSGGQPKDEKLQNDEKPGDDPAAKVSISDAGRLASLQIREFDATTSFLKIDEDFFSHEARARSRAEFAESIANRQEIDPFDNEFQIMGVKGEFLEASLEYFVSNALEGKARNASMVAGELGQMIRSAAYNNGATVEERAIKRETGLRHAEYIAQNYFEDPDEAKAFMDGVMRFYENDVMRDKGYIVLDGSNIAPFRHYSTPGAPSGYVNITAIARHFGASEEVLKDPLKTFDFFAEIFKNQIITSPETEVTVWQGDIAKAFDENSDRVADIISLIRETLNENDVANSLIRLLKAF